MVGDEEQREDGDIAPTVPIVEISRRESHPRAADYEEDEDDHYSDDDDFDEDDDLVDNVALSSPRRPSPSPRLQPSSLLHKPVNGRKRVDMTPPDLKLEKSQELALKFADQGKAEFHAENARSIMLHGGHTASSMEEKAQLYAVLIKIYRVLGQAATGLKKYPEAEQALQKADKISQERSRLSCVSDKECDQLDIALFTAMARSLELSKGRHANFDKAINLFLQAHSIAAAIHKEGHPELIDTALALSQAYASTGWEEAEASALSYLEECVSSCTTIYGPSSPKTLEVNDHLAKMMVRMDKSQEAMQILRSSLPLKTEVFGDYSEPVSDTYKLMGSISLSEGSIEKALRAYKKCHTIEVILLGKNHRKTKDTLQTMEMLMASPGLSHKFVLNKADELQKRPRFNSVVGRTK
ncbi:tetratricopeptide repeat protein 23 [Elysia marginata]|uniref:Tetratricopeptide repeat protein 23 n=1 Tax=Elysia marginata TaxID=1093978 RepID=A0AAV4EAX3_9GAST|nr:tetratricopeptide repeat protein 23 [Elysia marginata]